MCSGCWQCVVLDMVSQHSQVVQLNEKLLSCKVDFDTVSKDAFAAHLLKVPMLMKLTCYSACASMLEEVGGGVYWQSEHLVF